jgi:sugar phosphate isomerase/epimerase
MYSRRELFELAAGTLGIAGVLSAKPNSVVRGVMLGAQSYSFRDRPIQEAMRAISEAGLSYCELWQGHIEPHNATRKGLREWRENISLELFSNYATEFSKAGIKLYAYNYSFKDDFSEREMERGFEMARALGVKYITASANVDLCPRINAHAVKYGIVVGMHNHDSMKENEFSTPDDFTRAMEGNANIRINLDIGHFTAANFDALDYIGRMSEYLVTLHLKDRKKNHGANVPFGEGDTPIREVLQLLRAKRLKIPAMIEYEYEGADPVAEVRRCYEYCRKVVDAAAD